jgi:hypothetical protein
MSHTVRAVWLCIALLAAVDCIGDRDGGRRWWFSWCVAAIFASLTAFGCGGGAFSVASSSIEASADVPDGRVDKVDGQFDSSGEFPPVDSPADASMPEGGERPEDARAASERLDVRSDEREDASDAAAHLGDASPAETDVDAASPMDARVEASSAPDGAGPKWPGPGEASSCSSSSDCPDVCTAYGGSALCFQSTRCACLFPTEAAAAAVCVEQCKRAGWSSAHVLRYCWCENADQ